MNLTNHDKFAYSLGFLDCWIFLSNRTSSNRQRLRDRHVTMLELVRQHLDNPCGSLELDQAFVNEFTRIKFWKEILEIAENKILAEDMTKLLKGANIDQSSF